MMRKKQNRKGMSLAETLVTVLIFSVVLLGATTAGNACLNIYREIREKADAQTLLSTAITEVAGDMYYAKETDSKGFYCDTRNSWIYYTNSDDGKIIRNYYTKTTDDDGNTVIKDVDSEPVLTGKTQSLDLITEISSLTVNNNGCLSFTVQVKDKAEKVIEEQDVFVRSSLMTY